jgi:hypothetical protein
LVDQSNSLGEKKGVGAWPVINKAWNV